MRNLIYLLVFIARVLKHGMCFNRFSYTKKYSGRMVILANGPSLKDVLSKIEVDKEFENVEFTVMNFFAFDSAFQRIKPRFYCLADPMYIKRNHRYDQVEKLFHYLQDNVDWNMNLYIPKWFGRKNFLRYSSLNNPHIHIISINGGVPYNSFECLRNWLLKKNFMLPVIGTVAQLGIYVALNSGFEKVCLYGVEHNMICSLFVNDENQLCYKEEYFYGSSAVIKPLIRNDNDQQYKIADYLLEMGVVFQSHDWLARYAESLGVKIINCTPVSMIDSYERIRKNYK